MENITELEKKLAVLQKALIRRFPILEKEFLADPTTLKNIFEPLPLEISWKPPIDELTLEQERMVIDKYYPETLLFFDYLRPLWKRCHKSNGYEEQLRKEALSHVKNNPDKFPSIRPSHLSDIDLFKWPSIQQRRYFIGNILAAMVKDIYKLRVSASRLLNTIKINKYNKLS
jgi:hypothetical protein